MRSVCVSVSVSRVYMIWSENGSRFFFIKINPFLYFYVYTHLFEYVLRHDCFAAMDMGKRMKLDAFIGFQVLLTHISSSVCAKPMECLYMNRMVEDCEV